MADIFEPFILRRDEPIDSRIVVSDRNDLDPFTVYDGLVVYDTTDNELFILTGNVGEIQSRTLTNDDWTIVRSGPGNHDDFEYTVVGDTQFRATELLQTQVISLSPTDSKFTYSFISASVTSGTGWSVTVDNTQELHVDAAAGMRMNSRATITVTIMTSNSADGSIGMRDIQIEMFKYQPVFFGIRNRNSVDSTTFEGVNPANLLGAMNFTPYSYGDSIHLNFNGTAVNDMTGRLIPQDGVIGVPVDSFATGTYSMYAGGFPLTFDSSSSFMNSINTDERYIFFVLPIRRDLTVRLDAN